MDSEPEESYSSESDGNPIFEEEESLSSELEGSHCSEPEGSDGYYSSHDSDANQSIQSDYDKDDGDEEISIQKDRISTLSDSILIRILSFLPMKYVVATSILSKRWQFLWTMVPNLVFRFRRRDQRFENSIDGTLVLHQNSQIKKFLIDFSYQLQFQSSVNVWIRLATRKNVEELHLEFRVCQHSRSPSMDYAYTLPQFLYANSSIVKLSLRFCNIKPIGMISWPSLKTLSIASVELRDDLIKGILSGCPALESLELHHCFGIIDSLNITSASLTKLVINRYWDSPHSHHRSVLKISAPNVQSLSILGNIYTKECRVTNVPSLFDASLNFELVMQEGNSKDHYRLYRKVVMGLLKSVNHVKALTVGTWCIQVLSIFEGKKLSSLLSNLKCLILDTCLNKWDLPGIATLLQSSTNLEIFVINMISPCSRQICVDLGFSFTNLCNFDEEKYWGSREGVLVNSLINLKTVKIIGVIWNQPGIELVFGLVKFLLKNARMLEKVEICAKRDSHSSSQWNSLKSAESLLSFPRASPNAVVLFS